MSIIINFSLDPEPHPPKNLDTIGRGDTLTCSLIDFLDNSFFEYLKALSPSSVDVEIRSLTSLTHLEIFLKALTQHLKSHKDFEAVQAFLAVFLNVHGDVLIVNSELRDVLVELKIVQERESGRLAELIRYSLGTIGFLRSA